MTAVATIVPIFAVIFLGWVARRKGMAPQAFLGPANQLVFYLAIPAMIFRAIAKSSFGTQFEPRAMGITLACVGAGFALAWSAAAISGMPRHRRGTFVQSGFHGNLGYIGLAVAFYFLGQAGLVRASIIAGFVMILQNFLAVVALQGAAGQPGSALPFRQIALRMAGNPVIVSALAGILFSLMGITLPLVVDRSLSILSGLALPMALLLIGASLSFDLVRDNASGVLAICIIKLIVMPGLGMLAFRVIGLDPAHGLPGLILLASPVATLTYVMAGEMGGDQDLAVAAISVSTLLSALTLSIWMQAGIYFL